MPLLRQLGEEGLPEGFGKFWYGSPPEEALLDPTRATAQSSLTDILRDLDVTHPAIRERVTHPAFRDVLSLQSPSGEELKIFAALDSGAILVHPDKNHREYKGSIALARSESGEWLFVALAEWGRSRTLLRTKYRKNGPPPKVLYAGDNLLTASNVINERLAEKALSGYLVPGGEPYHVDHNSAEKTFRETLSRKD
jgi:hypothetical protein